SLFAPSPSARAGCNSRSAAASSPTPIPSANTRRPCTRPRGCCRRCANDCFQKLSSVINHLVKLSPGLCMYRRLRFLPLLALLLFPVTARAQTKMEWKLKPGDVFFVEEVTQVRQTLILMGSETRQDLDQTRVLRFTVLKKNQDGGLVLAKKIEAIKI